MAMNYTALVGDKTVVGSIQSFVRYSLVPADVVLEEAQSLIYSRLRVREMRISTTVSLSVGASAAPLPTGYLDPIAMQDREGWNVIPEGYISEDQLLRARTYSNNVLDTGVPRRCAVFDEQFQFDCKSDAVRTLDLVFYKFPTLLGSTNNTNFLTTRYPKIVRVSCQAGAASFMKDSEEFNLREAEAIGLIDAANAESDLGKAA